MHEGRRPAPASGSRPTGGRGWDFFLSYTQADLAWAEWIAWQLEDLGFRVLFQAWDFVPGTHWTAGMQDGMARSTRTIAVLSAAYLRSVYGAAEWQAAFRADPRGFERKLVPIRVEPCQRPGLLGGVVSFDVFGRSAERARAVLADQIAAVLAGRAKPTAEPAYPGTRVSPPAPPTRPVPPNSPPPSYPGTDTPAPAGGGSAQATTAVDGQPTELPTRARVAEPTDGAAPSADWRFESATRTADWPRWLRHVDRGLLAAPFLVVPLAIVAGSYLLAGFLSSAGFSLAPNPANLLALAYALFGVSMTARMYGNRDSFVGSAVLCGAVLAVPWALGSLVYLLVVLVDLLPDLRSGVPNWGRLWTALGVLSLTIAPTATFLIGGWLARKGCEVLTGDTPPETERS